MTDHYHLNKAEQITANHTPEYVKLIRSMRVFKWTPKSISLTTR